MHYYGTPGKTSRHIVSHLLLFLLAAWITTKAFDSILGTANLEVSYGCD